MTCQHCRLGDCQPYEIYFFYAGEYILGHKLTHRSQNLNQTQKQVMRVLGQNLSFSFVLEVELQRV